MYEFYKRVHGNLTIHNKKNEASLGPRLVQKFSLPPFDTKITS